VDLAYSKEDEAFRKTVRTWLKANVPKKDKTLSDLPPRFAAVVRLNPMTSFTTATQDLLFVGRLPELHVWAIMAAIATVSWVAGAGLFSRLSDTLAEAV